MDIPHYIYPFISWWTLVLFPPFGCCEYYYEDSSLNFFCRHIFLFLLGIPRSGFAGTKVNICSTTWKTYQTFPKWLHHFTFPLAVYKGSSFCISLPTLVTVFFFSIIIILVGFIVDLLWIFLVSNDVEASFHVLLAIEIPPWEENLSFSHF